MQKTYQTLAWALFTVAVVVPLVAWLSLRDWSVSNIGLYSIFPLLGLWAWNIMWVHYAYGSVLILDGKAKKDKTFKSVTQWLVLALILMHPGLLALAQFQNTDLLPPESYFSYVGQAASIYIVFGLVAITAFLAFDALERLKKKEIVRKYWWWVSLSQVVAMSLIFVHSMAIGQTLQLDWFQFYWVSIGALLIPCFGLILRYDWDKNPN